MRYSIAVKRKYREEMPADWVEQLSACEGLELEGDRQFGRLVVKANDRGIEAARALLGEMLHIEPLTFYSPSKASDEDVETPAVESPWARRTKQ